MLKVYNSLTNKIEEFIPVKNNRVNMYVCGPTVWNYIHIGNARPVVFYDMVKRYLEFIGYSVYYASNITDVDDKIINEAEKQNVTEKELTKKYEEAFFNDVKKLNSNPPDIVPHATDYIMEMVDFIGELENKGYAYNSDGDYYFRINKISDYGILSNQVSKDLLDGVRIEISDKKENPNDFSLWKKETEKLGWESKIGRGRPGWHTECVVMNHKIFGDEIDIHGGGMDLKFPHHENEIAQAKAAFNHNLAKYWMHVGRLMFNGEKMSKSLGNVLFVNEITDFDELMTLRLLLVSAPYRQNINYNEELANFYIKEYDKIKRAYKQAIFIIQYNDITDKAIVDEDIITNFKNYMNDDFNTPNVMTLINTIIKLLNAEIRSSNILNVNKYFNTLEQILNVLGINVKYQTLTYELKNIYLLWEEARTAKDFLKADEYRSLLISKGII